MFRLTELASRIDAQLSSDTDCEIYAVASLDRAGKGDLCFISNRRYRNKLKSTQASAVILEKSLLDDCPVPALVTPNPYLAYARAACLLNPDSAVEAGIHSSAVVHSRASINPAASIGPLCFIGENVVIEAGVRVGPSCNIMPGCHIGHSSQLLGRVTVYKDTLIGERVLIHSGAVIGSDGFGLANDNGKWVKIPQLGRVVVGNDVEIGANTTIDRGTLEDTVIEDGVKLDNLVQVAHNVTIGAHTAVAGCVGIAGSAKIGKHCMIGGAAGIQGHIEICDHVTVTGMTKISQSIREPGVYTSGTPFEKNEKWLKNSARYRQLDGIARRVKALEKK